MRFFSRKLQGTGLFVYGDAAGAKATLSLVCLLKQQEQLSDYILLANNKYDFEDTFGLDIQYPDDNWQSLLNGVQFDYIFTGTSIPKYSSLENEVIRWGRDKAISTYAFIDYWANFKIRFTYMDELVYPDEVWVVDEHAKHLATKDGIPSNLVRVSGNPYYVFLKQWHPVLNRNAFFRSIGIDSNNVKIILFAPEALSDANGKAYYGFDETTVLETLIDVLLTLKDPDPFLLLVKPHPLQQIEKLTSIIDRVKSGQLNIGLIQNVDTNTLLYHVDLIIGMFSNILVEASFFNSNIIRFLPKKPKEDVLHSRQPGRLIHDKGEFKQELESCIYT